MCGRYVVLSEPEELARHFAVDRVAAAPPASYNVAPTMQVPAVVEADGERSLGPLTWGFVPWFSKNPRKPPRPINARLESVATNGMFRDALEHRRCVLPADGFFEWQVLPDGSKQPWFIHHPEREPLAFAGIWSSWRDRSEAADASAPRLYSAAIVTTAAAGPLLPELHDRMPVVLPRDAWDRWLDVTADLDATALVEQLRALGDPGLAAHRVSTQVNDVRNDAEENIAPL